MIYSNLLQLVLIYLINLNLYINVYWINSLAGDKPYLFLKREGDY